MQAEAETEFQTKMIYFSLSVGKLWRKAVFSIAEQFTFILYFDLRED